MLGEVRGVGYVLGVDLGSTWVKAAVDDGMRTEIVALGACASAIPAVIMVREDGELLFGETAEQRAAEDPARTAREFKRRLGDTTPLLLGGMPWGAEVLTARLLRGAFELVVQQRGGPPALTVVAHPADYGPYKLDLLRQAARLADIAPVQFIAEPVAAALHNAGREPLEPGQIIAVYRLGGITFDATILRRVDGNVTGGFEALGEPERIDRFGGADFDEAVFSHVIDSLGDAWQQLDRADPETSASIVRLREQCRLAKESLSQSEQVDIPVSFPALQTTSRISRAEFETMIQPRLAETIAALERALRHARVAVDDVTRVLLVGGSSSIPLVARTVTEATGRPVALAKHPQHAVALGAAMSGRRARLDTADSPPPVASTPSSFQVVDPTLIVRAPRNRRRAVPLSSNAIAALILGVAVVLAIGIVLFG